MKLSSTKLLLSLVTFFLVACSTTPPVAPTVDAQQKFCNVKVVASMHINPQNDAEILYQKSFKLPVTDDRTWANKNADFDAAVVHARETIAKSRGKVWDVIKEIVPASLGLDVQDVLNAYNPAENSDGCFDTVLITMYWTGYVSYSADIHGLPNWKASVLHVPEVPSFKVTLDNNNGSNITYSLPWRPLENIARAIATSDKTAGDEGFYRSIVDDIYSSGNLIASTKQISNVDATDMREIATFTFSLNDQNPRSAFVKALSGALWINSYENANKGSYLLLPFVQDGSFINLPFDDNGMLIESALLKLCASGNSAQTFSGIIYYVP